MAFAPVRDYSRLPRSDSAAFALMCETDWYDTPEPPARLPDQVTSAYNHLLSGKSEIQVKLAIQEQYGDKAQATRAFNKALNLIIQEQRAAREHMPELIMAIRFNAIQRAIQSGQLGAAAGMLRDAGAACGEAALDAAGATLTVEVLPMGAAAGEGALQPPVGGSESDPAVG